MELLVAYPALQKLRHEGGGYAPPSRAGLNNGNDGVKGDTGRTIM